MIATSFSCIFTSVPTVKNETISFAFLLIFAYHLYFSDVCVCMYFLPVYQGRIVMMKKMYKQKRDSSYSENFFLSSSPWDSI